MPFKQMENISLYLQACRALGVTDYDLFQARSDTKVEYLPAGTYCDLFLARSAHLLT